MATIATGLLHACASTPPARPRPAGPIVGAPSARGVVVAVRVAERGAVPRIRRLPLETYVAGCVDAELGRLDIDPAAADRMRRIQAVLCRTYALANLGRHAGEGFDLCATTHCQLFRQLPAEAIAARMAMKAASDTDGLVIVYEGKPIQALFHANCGGRTSAADAVWGGTPLPYLVSVRDTFCEAAARWKVDIDRTRLAEVLQSDTRTNVGNRLDRLTVVEQDSAGRAIRITVAGSSIRTVRADAFRAIVTGRLGAQTLRSTWFTVRRDHERFVFEGRGFGHGVGLCQAGAISRAAAGQSEAAILKYYFPGTELQRSVAPR